MVEYELDRITVCPAPPTPQAIDRVRREQLDALKMLRRRLLEVLDSQKSAA